MIKVDYSKILNYITNKINEYYHQRNKNFKCIFINGPSYGIVTCDLNEDINKVIDRYLKNKTLINNWNVSACAFFKAMHKRAKAGYFDEGIVKTLFIKSIDELLVYMDMDICQN